MYANVIKYCSRTTIVFLEGLAIVLLILAILFGLAIWKVTSGSFDVSFAKNYIESALDDPSSGYSVKLDKVSMEWPDITEPLFLKLGNIRLIKEEKVVVAVDAAALALSQGHLWIGKIKPVEITLGDPTLHLIRSENNRILFELEDRELEPREGEMDTVNPVMDVIETLSRSPDEISKDSPLDKLRVFQVQNAQIIVEDHALGMTWFLPDTDLAFARDDAGMVIQSNLKLPGGRDEAGNIQADIIYKRDQPFFDIQAHIQDFNPHILSRKIKALDVLNDHQIILNGNIKARLSEDMKLQSVNASLSSFDGVLRLNDIYDKPLLYQEALFDVSYNAAENYLDVKDISIKIAETEIALKAPVRFSDKKIAAAVTVQVPELVMKNVPSLWPSPLLEGEPAEKWMLERLSEGRILDTEFKIDIYAQKSGEDWDVEAKNIKSTFSIEDMKVDYRAPLRAVTNAFGRGKFEHDILTIYVERGDLGDLVIKDSQVIVDHVIEEGAGDANINVKLTGPIKSVFDYIAEEPINKSAEDIGLDATKVKGTTNLDVNISFPTLKDLPAEKVKVKATGTLRDVVLPNVVKGLPITDGPLNLKLGDGLVSLNGNAKLDGRPVKLDWQQYLELEGKPYASKVEASLTADKKLRDHFGINIDDWMVGDLPIELTYTEFQDDRAEAVVTGDLKPVTVMVSPFDYAKPVGVAGTMQLKAMLHGGFLKEIRDLSVKTPKLSMDKGRLLFEIVKGDTELRKGSLLQIQLDETNINMDFEIGTSGLLKMDINGGFFDARPFLKPKTERTEPYDGPPIIVSLAADRMRTADNRLIEKTKTYLDMNREGRIHQLEMDARAGKGDIYFRLKPDRNGVMTVRLESGDAGALLRAFGIYETVQGGKLVLEGAAKTASKNHLLQGNVSLTDFRVTEAPALARLLGALGPTSLSTLFSDEGIYFSKLESKFDWHIREKGDLYVLTSGRTSGSSLGLTFDGKIDKAANYIDIKGNVVPISMLNSMVSGIPVIGDILAGGEGGAVLAATYKIKGPVKKPEVSVNPLAALAPGILRKLLFEDSE